MTLVVASSRPWHDDMALRLAERTGRDFAQIARPDELTAANLQAIGATRIFFPHWSHIIASDVFERFECIIFHMTDLPYGRGGSPLQNLIVRGHKETVISALRCAEGVDAGPIYLKRPLSLEGAAREIFARASEIIENMIVEIVTDDPAPVPQQGEPTLFKRRKPDDGDLANTDIGSLEAAYDHIRMLDADGYPRAFVQIGPWRIEFENATFNGKQLTARAAIAFDAGRAKEKR